MTAHNIFFIEEIFVGFSTDLRTAVLGFIDLGNSVKLACKMFLVSRPSIQRWRNKQTSTGVLDSTPRKKIPYKFDIDALSRLNITRKKKPRNIKKEMK